MATVNNKSAQEKEIIRLDKEYEGYNTQYNKLNLNFYNESNQLVLSLDKIRKELTAIKRKKSPAVRNAKFSSLLEKINIDKKTIEQALTNIAENSKLIEDFESECYNKGCSADLVLALKADILKKTDIIDCRDELAELVNQINQDRKAYNYYRRKKETGSEKTIIYNNSKKNLFALLSPDRRNWVRYIVGSISYILCSLSIILFDETYDILHSIKIDFNFKLYLCSLTTFFLFFSYISFIFKKKSQKKKFMRIYFIVSGLIIAGIVYYSLSEGLFKVRLIYIIIISIITILSFISFYFQTEKYKMRRFLTTLSRTFDSCMDKYKYIEVSSYEHKLLLRKAIAWGFIDYRFVYIKETDKLNNQFIKLFIDDQNTIINNKYDSSSVLFIKLFSLKKHKYLLKEEGLKLLSQNSKLKQFWNSKIMQLLLFLNGFVAFSFIYSRFINDKGEKQMDNIKKIFPTDSPNTILFWFYIICAIVIAIIVVDAVHNLKSKRSKRGIINFLEKLIIEFDDGNSIRINGTDLIYYRKAVALDLLNINCFKSDRNPNSCVYIKMSNQNLSYPISKKGFDFLPQTDPLKRIWESGGVTTLKYILGFFASLTVIIANYSSLDKFF